MDTAHANARLQSILAFLATQRQVGVASGELTPASLDYRWKHTLRVVQYGKQLATEEQADIEVVLAACLLHDLVKFLPGDHGVDHGREGARLARPFLETLGYPPAQVNNICYAIAVHVDNQADFEHPVTLESKIVSDADDIDRFSAYRILLQLHRDIDDFDTLIRSAQERLTKIQRYRNQNVMGTPSGNRLFNRQLELHILFLERLLADNRLTILPEF
jgi:hypothetical protein